MRCRLVGFGLVAALVAAAGAQEGEWGSYAADPRSTKYSPLDQIHRGNVAQLRIAWRAPSIEHGVAQRHPGLRAGSLFETTPLYAGGRLLLATGIGVAAAYEPSGGELLWTWDPYAEGEAPHLGSLGFRVYRGGVSWREGEERRFIFTGNGRLTSLDARTGRPDPRFGAKGRIDLRAGAAESPEPYFWTSPPVVCRDTIVVGNSTTDLAPRKRAPKSRLRGYDVRTGQLLWTFNIIPERGEPGYETWLEGSAEATGHANVWTWMTCDEELGTVYAPTTTPNNDWYGGHRPGAGLYAESLLCLEARTGRLVWHFQAVHHGLWDYDFPAGPILADITVGGRPIKAVGQVSKQAFLYLFDRTNGEPVWPIVELPVPSSTVAGERAWPTQPFPTWPKAYDRQGLALADLIDFTPELRAEALRLLAPYHIGPLFLPPRLRDQDGIRAIIQMPSAVGGTNWNGAAYDPETHVVYVPSVTVVSPIAVHPPLDPARSDVTYLLDISAPRTGSPNLDIDGLPIVKPPWGRITAIDLDTGEHLWMTPNGPGPRDHPRLAGLDLPWLGHHGRASPLVTRTLLFHADGSPDLIGVPDWSGGKKFRALDKATGEVVWEIELPAGASGAPMTYLHAGTQYIVVPIGDRSVPGELLALALPDR